MSVQTKTLALGLVAALLAGCGSSSGQANEQYFDAIQKKLDGDQHGFYDDLMRLAVEEPNTRAGRRARTAVAGGGDMLTLFGTTGVLAAIAIPNFIKFQAKAKQSEAKTVLKALATAQKSYLAEKNRYCRTFAECEVTELVTEGQYTYFLGADVAGAPGTESLRIEALSLMESLGIEPIVSSQGFVMVAVGNIDTDDDLDIWTMDDEGILTNVVSDI